MKLALIHHKITLASTLCEEDGPHKFLPYERLPFICGEEYGGLADDDGA